MRLNPSPDSRQATRRTPRASGLRARSGSRSCSAATWALGSDDIFRTGITVRKIPVYQYVIFSYRYFPPDNFKLYKARFRRLYRSRVSHPNSRWNSRWKALAKIYAMHSVLQLSNLNIFVNICLALVNLIEKLLSF